MNQPLRRFDSPLQAARTNRQRSSGGQGSQIKLPQPQEPKTRGASRRPAPYRYSPSRRAAVATANVPRTRSRPTSQRATPLRNPSVKLSNPHQPQSINRLAPLPEDSQRGGRLVTKNKDSNPALAIHLLREIEEVVVGWQRELKQILVELQNLYLEGPMVNGWLESDENLPNSGATSARPYPNQNAAYPDYQGRVSYEVPRPGYRLCGRDEQGQIWVKICPPEQVSAVSLAIARYQKLCQLLKKKQGLEHRLSNIAQTLVRVHSTLKQ